MYLWNAISAIDCLYQPSTEGERLKMPLNTIESHSPHLPNATITEHHS